MSEGASPDPLAPLFDGRSARALFEAGVPSVVHGPLERLPEAFRSGLLASPGHLARHFPGTVQIANGTPAQGAQVQVGRAPAAQLLDLGLTVGFDAVQDHAPALKAWCRQLEQALGVPPDTVRLMAFANAPGTGLPLHHDVHDQLLIHLQGEKTLHWAPNAHVEGAPAGRFAHHDPPQRSFGADYARGFPPTPEAVFDAGMEAVPLRPGSVLFVPGGTWHTTAEQTDTTLSVAVIVHAPSRNEVLLNLLAWHLRQSAAGRRRAYGGWGADPASALEGLEAHARAVASELATLDLGHAFDAWQLDRGVGDPRQVPGDAAFARYVRLPFAQLTLHDHADGLAVRVRCGRGHHAHADTSLLTRADARPVLDWIAGCHRVFAVEELEGLSPTLPADELRVLLGALSQAQWLRGLPTAPWGAGG